MPIIVIYFLVGSLFIGVTLLILAASAYAVDHFVNGTGNRWIARLVAFSWFATVAIIFGYVLIR
jgi:hypothetical protein